MKVVPNFRDKKYHCRSYIASHEWIQYNIVKYKFQPTFHHKIFRLLDSVINENKMTRKRYYLADIIWNCNIKKAFAMLLMKWS